MGENRRIWVQLGLALGMYAVLAVLCLGGAGSQPEYTYDHDPLVESPEAADRELAEAEELYTAFDFSGLERDSQRTSRGLTLSYWQVH